MESSRRVVVVQLCLDHKVGWRCRKDGIADADSAERCPSFPCLMVVVVKVVR